MGAQRRSHSGVRGLCKIVLECAFLSRSAGVRVNQSALCGCKKGARMFSDFFQSYLHIKTSMWESWHMCVVVCVRLSLLQAPTHYRSQPSERSPPPSPSPLASMKKEAHTFSGPGPSPSPVVRSHTSVAAPMEAVCATASLRA